MQCYNWALAPSAMRTYWVLAGLLLCSPFPARASLYVVHPRHPMVPGLFGVDGVFRPALTSTHASLVAAMSDATAPGDTVYVYPGAGSYDENLAASHWRANDVVLTGIRTNPLVAGTQVPMVGRAEIRPTTLLYGSFYLELPPGGSQARTGCRLEYLRLDGAHVTPAIGIRSSGTRQFRLSHCWIEGNISTAIMQGAGASNPDTRALDFTVDACSLGVSPTAPITTWPILISHGLGSGGTALWGGDGIHLTNNIIDLRAVRLAKGNLGSVLFAATVHSSITGNVLYTAVPAVPGFFCGIGILSQGLTPAITDSLEIAGNCIEVTPLGDPGARIITVTVGMSLGTRGSICDGVHIHDNTLRMPFVRSGQYFGIKVEADFNAPSFADDDAYSDDIVIERNLLHGATVGVGLHENARNCRVIANDVTFGDSTVVSHGLVLEDARSCVVADNVVRRYQRGISLEPSNSDNPPAPSWHNYRNSVLRNRFERCGRVVNVVRYEPPPPAAWDADDTLSVPVDSLGVWEGNLALGCSAWVKLQTFNGSAPTTYAEAVAATVFTYRTAEWWSACHQPGPLGLRSGSLPPRTIAIGAHPNPFNATTTITFQVARAGSLRVAIYSARGARVRDLLGATVPAGDFTMAWDGNDGSGRRVGSGVYFVRVDAPDGSGQCPVILLK